MRLKTKAFITLLCASVSAFAVSDADMSLGNDTGEKILNVDTKPKKQMSPFYGDLLDGIRAEALKKDPIFMSTHKDEALELSLLNPSDSMPARTHDHYVKIFILPYVTSDGVYHGASTDVFRHKEGRFVLANDAPDTDDGQVVGGLSK